MNETSIETKNAVLAGVEAAKQPKSSAILFQLLNKGAAAKLDVYDCSKISNAYICIRQNHSSMIWSVQDGEYVSCPTSLMIWIKNSKKMGIAVKSTETSESQFILNNGKDFFFPEDFSIHGLKIKNMASLFSSLMINRSLHGRKIMKRDFLHSVPY